MTIDAVLVHGDSLEEWRRVARPFLAAREPPENLAWRMGESMPDLFAEASADPPWIETKLSLPRRFFDLAGTTILHHDPERFGLLYRLAYRLTSQPELIADHADPLLRRLELMAKAVRRDIHKMRAFLRFREIDERFVAWFEPEHHILRANGGFFVRRFTAMQWSILTPSVSLHWDGDELREGPGADRRQAAGADSVEEIWKAYYASIFNPARLKIGSMLKEMPRRYWKNMPEATLIAPLIADAQAREVAMTSPGIAPAERATTLEGLSREAQSCRRCPLWQGATGCVFGRGPGHAKLMIVGEQPGDEEDKAGTAFIGPAGQLLDRALMEASIDRGSIYLTNAVKHFKFTLRGKRRIHQNPAAGEIDMCRWWLEQEIGLLRPKAIVMLGASAIRGVTGRNDAVGTMRGKLLPMRHGVGVPSYHPAYILRQPDREAASEAYRMLVQDLRLAASAAA